MSSAKVSGALISAPGHVVLLWRLLRSVFWFALALIVMAMG